MSRSVPEKWLPYTSYGDVIKGTKIFAFKVPLKETVANKLQPDQRFTPKMLLEAMPRIKYVIDLTNTHRYYDQRDFTEAGLKYTKIMVPGRLIPQPKLVKRFFKAMDDFLETSEPDDLVGVHCTHGVNRTGYFICRYLIQQLGWENQDAVTAFQEARGYPIERDVYVNDLKITVKGAKIDTQGITLDNPVVPTRGHKRMVKTLMGPPPGFHPPRRGFHNGRSFPPPPRDHFGYGPRVFNRPMPPMPPPHGSPYGPRPVRYGPPPSRGLPPSHGFPPRMPPGPPRMPMPGGPPRLSGPPGPMGPPRPMGPPGPGPRLPPHGPPKPMSSSMKGPPMLHSQKKKHSRDGGGVTRKSQIASRRKSNEPLRHVARLVHREQDFTLDTFEENLTTAVLPVAVTNGPRRRNKGRYNSRVSRDK